MSGNLLNEGTGGKMIPRAEIMQLMTKNFDRLPDIDQKLFLYGPLYLSGNSTLAGLVANNMYRRALNVSHAPFSSSLPMGVLPFLTTFALYNAVVCRPLMYGDLNCPSCVLLRGALVGVVSGALYPIFLALPLNIGLATRYSSAPMPEKGAILRFSWEISRPILKKMRAVMLLQTFFATYLSSKNLDSYAKLLQLTFDSEVEELKD
ncbi:transmembrane protein 126A [Genypterus blacodes]|uniref:transmembrane protein 126A n=1 Tax=Genypterus blacodes TaxID=154954 RepID=UPI003F775AE9